MLARLLQMLDDIKGDFWIRVLYCHPANLDRDVIKVIRDSKHICKYIDIPVEHISDKILKKMNRRITKKEILSLINHIRKEISNVALRTSLIVGFPGEDEKDFLELIPFIKEARFERLGLFKYSREDGTPAYNFEGQVSEEEKEARFNRVMLVQEEISKDINNSFKGRSLKVLIDEKNTSGFLGRTEYDAPEVDGNVYIKDKGLEVGNFYQAHIVDTYEYDLIGLVAPVQQTNRP